MGQTVGPFHVCRATEKDVPDDAKRNLILLQIEKDKEEGDWLVLPQFEIEIPFRGEDHPTLDDVVHRLGAFYAGLRELPSDYVNEVERAQLDLLERSFLPWLVSLLGRNQQYWTVPPTEVEFVGNQDDRDLASA